MPHNIKKELNTNELLLQLCFIRHFIKRGCVQGVKYLEFSGVYIGRDCNNTPDGYFSHTWSLFKYDFVSCSDAVHM